MRKCTFCAHAAEQLSESPCGPVCEGCGLRMVRLVELGGEPVLACWGLTIVVPELASLVKKEMLALRSAPPDDRVEVAFESILQRGDWAPKIPVPSAEERLNTANEHFRAGRGVEALRDAASELARTPHGPIAVRALALVLGPMLRPGGEQALRAALFRT